MEPTRGHWPVLCFTQAYWLYSVFPFINEDKTSKAFFNNEITFIQKNLWILFTVWFTDQKNLYLSQENEITYAVPVFRNFVRIFIQMLVV